MKIIENIYIVPNAVANTHIIVDLGGLTINATDLPGRHKKILTHIATLNKFAQDIKHIILTHSNLDHVGGLSALQKAFVLFVRVMILP
jgi:glyoxylase-like metal-dependent hydrolase (beta-lactamase superfamily II)